MHSFINNNEGTRSALVSWNFVYWEKNQVFVLIVGEIIYKKNMKQKSFAYGKHNAVFMLLLQHTVTSENKIHSEYMNS